MIALVIDTETTGLTKHPNSKDSIQPQIIEFGAAVVEDGVIIDTMDMLVNPGVPLLPIITKITGVTDEDLADQPPFRNIIGAIRPLFARADTLVAHNLPFDKGMLTFELKRCGHFADWPWPEYEVCTVQEHAEHFGYRPTMKKLYEYYFGSPLEQTHRALDDVGALVKIALAAGVIW